MKFRTVKEVRDSLFPYKKSPLITRLNNILTNFGCEKPFISLLNADSRSSEIWRLRDFGRKSMYVLIDEIQANRTFFSEEELFIFDAFVKDFKYETTPRPKWNPKTTGIKKKNGKLYTECLNTGKVLRLIPVFEKIPPEKAKIFLASFLQED